VWDDTTLRDDH
jgi:hypothetical protein